MVICPLCLQSTVGEQGEEVTCAHCETRFVAGHPVAPKALHSPQKKTLRPRISHAVMLYALAPFFSPAVAMSIWLFAPGETAFGYVVLPLLVLLGGWLLGGIAFVKAKKIGSRWSTVASVAIWVSLFEIPLLFGLFLLAARAAYMPGR